LVDLVANGLPTEVVTHQPQVKRRTEKVRQSQTDILPLCHATNCRHKRLSLCILWGCHNRLMQWQQIVHGGKVCCLWLLCYLQVCWCISAFVVLGLVSSVW